MSRSGYGDPQSQIVLRQLRDLNCQIDLLRGDVTKLEDVRKIFDKTTHPIAGIIQGAMVLRVSTKLVHPCPSMSLHILTGYCLGPTFCQDDC